MTETFIDRFTRTRAEYLAAKDAYDAWREEAVRAEYARMRDADRAAGRDTSGKSVSSRRCRAYDAVMMSDEARERREAVDVAEAAYRAAREV